MRIYLRKNDTSENDKLPYFTMFTVPEEDGGEWKEIAAFWKAKSGKGYNGVLGKGVEIDTSAMVPYKKPEAD